MKVCSRAVMRITLMSSSAEIEELPAVLLFAFPASQSTGFSAVMTTDSDPKFLSVVSSRQGFCLLAVNQLRITKVMVKIIVVTISPALTNAEGLLVREFSFMISLAVSASKSSASVIACPVSPCTGFSAVKTTELTSKILLLVTP